MRRKLSTGVLGMCMLAFLAGCHSTKPHYVAFDPTRTATRPQLTIVTNSLDPAWLRAPTNLFTLGPGDRLEIELLDDRDSKTTTVVGPDGKIYFNLLPGMDVWGLTLGQTKGRMENELSKYIRGTPRVSVTLRGVESKRVWMLGRFQAPGVYTMATPMTLLEAISMAGGSLSFSSAREITGGPLSEDLADLRRSFVIRNGKLLPVDMQRLLTMGDLSQNIYLQPDDLVYFSPTFAREVYVLGAVVQPKAVQYSDGMTLAGAIAGAFGMAKDAYLSHVTIVRGSLSMPEATTVNYSDIVHGRAPDVALEPHDIVYVPFSPYRYLKRYVNIALDTFVSSVAIQAGTTAIHGKENQTQGGVFIPVGSGVQVLPPQPPPIH
jgi:protein involved in polysaccharide export with SLBB domain